MERALLVLLVVSSAAEGVFAALVGDLLLGRLTLKKVPVLPSCLSVSFPAVVEGGLRVATTSVISAVKLSHQRRRPPPQGHR